MKKLRTKWQKAKRWLLLWLAGVLLCGVCLPVWFPWVAAPVLGQFGVQYENYDRLGFSRFRLRQVQGEWNQTRVQSDEVECILPTVWFWWMVSPSATDEAQLLIRNGHLTIDPKVDAGAAHTKAVTSSFQLLDQISQVGRALRQYLPPARLTNGTVTIGSTQLTIPAAEWCDGNVTATVQHPAAPGPAAITVTVTNQDELRLSISQETGPTHLSGSLTRKPNQWIMAGEASWMTNRARLSAQFTTNGWWPDQARIESAPLRLPAEQLKLTGYQGIEGAVLVGLVSNQFTLRANARTVPLDSDPAPAFPPVQVELRAHGNPDSVTLDQLQLDAPWIRASLSNALNLRWTSELMDEAARLQVELDLAGLPGVALTGKSTGQVSVNWNDTRIPLVQFQLGGVEVGGWGVQSKSARLSGTLNWPELTLETVAAEFEDGSRLRASGGLEVTTRQLHNAEWHVSGPLWQRYLGKLSYAEIEARGTASGSLTNPTHSGTLTATQLRAGPASATKAVAAWQAQGLHVTNLTVELNAGLSTLSFGGEVDAGDVRSHAISAILRKATLRQQGDVVLELRQPGEIRFSSGAEKDSAGAWRLSAQGLDWQGRDQQLSFRGDVEWPAQGAFQVVARNVALRDFSDFVAGGSNDVAVAMLEADAHWTNGPVQFAVRGDLAFRDSEGRTYRAQGKVLGGESLQIETLELFSPWAPALTVAGTLPLQLHPARTGEWLSFAEHGVMDMQAHLPPCEVEIPLNVGGPGSVHLSGLQLHANAGGTQESPTVELSLNANQASWQTATNQGHFPQLDQLTLAATVTPGQIELRSFQARIEGQQIKASGHWPFPEQFWKTVWHDRPLPDWKQATGRLQIEGASIAPLANHLPTVLAPEGRLDLNLELARGGRLDGLLTLTNAATRPVGKLPPLRDISARVKLSNSKGVLEEFHGQMGGQPIVATGECNLLTDASFQYQVQLRGTNVPLARGLDLLLRGDFEASLTGGAETPPTLAGKLTLKDGLYARHAAELLWSGPARPELQPPYFSVTNAPFANWKVDFDIQGDRFLRVRVPIFSGVLSAQLKVNGTLREPVLTGDVRADSGRVMFPFGTLKLNESRATLGGNESRGPILQVSANGRAYDYDLRVEVSGPLNGANVIFSSTPPLNSEDILLMLSAGELPEREYAFSTEAKAGRVASFLGSDLYNRYTGSGADEQRLIITSGEGISEEGKLTYSVEYRLTDRWSIIGEYDEFNAFNANLKWKVLSR